MEGYERLANEIILSAVKDFREAKKKLKRRPNNADAKLMVADCEKFFCSGWFGVLTSIDGQTLLKRLEEEYDTKGIHASGISA